MSCWAKLTQPESVIPTANKTGTHYNYSSGNPKPQYICEYFKEMKLLFSPGSKFNLLKPIGYLMHQQV
jgi:hypothetical protein